MAMEFFVNWEEDDEEEGEKHVGGVRMGREWADLLFPKSYNYIYILATYLFN